MSFLVAAAFPAWAWFIIVPAALLVAFCMLMFVVALVETTPVTQFADEPLAPDEAAELPPYLHAMNRSAGESGFVYGGTYRHAKYAGLFCTYWVSPDRRTLARVAGGTIAKMPHKSTVLSTELPDGRLLATRDEVAVTEISGVVEIRTEVHADFRELWAAHWQRVQPLGEAGTRTLDPSAPPRDIDRAWDRRQAEALVGRGLARWTDGTRAAFRYTLGGALRIVLVQFLGQFMRAASTGGSGYSRPRPGDVPEARGFPVQPAPPPPPVPPAASWGTPPAGAVQPYRSERDFLP